MRVIEFQTKLINNQIQIPATLQAQLKDAGGKEIRVMILIDDADFSDEQTFSKTTREQFLNGYAASDSVYDTY